MTYKDLGKINRIKADTDALLRQLSFIRNITFSKSEYNEIQKADEIISLLSNANDELENLEKIIELNIKNKYTKS